MKEPGQQREHWSSSFAFTLAAVGSAVGLGNIWKFPYISGENGGGAFVLVYLICILLLGLPILVAEMMLGRAGKRGVVGSVLALSKASKKSGTAWAYGMRLTILSAILLLSFYSVVGGWAIAYFVKAATGALSSLDPSISREVFGELIASPWEASIYHGLFMLGCFLSVVGGVSKGIEVAAKVLMPLLALLLLVLLGYSLTLPGSEDALRFMFYPDFSKLTGASVLEAMGHAFFTLSLGMGVLVVFGSYLSKKDNIFKSSLVIISADTVIALLSGVMVFGIVFSANLAPEAGPGLVFITLPSLFSMLPAGILWASLFFLLLTFAALTSGISILEVGVAYMVDHHQVPRKKATFWVAGFIFLLGLFSVLSFSVLEGVKIPIPGKEAASIFDALDYYISNWALVLNALLLSLFVGWGLKKQETAFYLKDDFGKPGLFSFWHSIMRYFTPLAVIVILLYSAGFLA